MNNKKYNSYYQIEQDLEILKLEKEICYKKLVQTLQKTKESFEPKNLLASVPRSILDILGGLSSPIKGMVISFILKKIFNTNK